MGMSNTTSSIRGVSGQETLTNFKRVQASSLEGDNISVTNATITRAVITNATITNASVNKLGVNYMTANAATIPDLKASSLIASYLNFTASRGSTGYGLRYNGGDIQSKHVGDVWRPLSHASEKSWSFKSPTGASGRYYFGGGYYNFYTGNNDFSATPAVSHGTANSSYAAHFMIVLGATAVDKIVLKVKGTIITDGGSRTANYEATLAIPDTSATGYMVETPEKFLGLITIKVKSGTAKAMNYGLCKYWDNNNSNFTVKGIEVIWLGGGSDSTPNIELLHHKTTGWAYQAASIPIHPTPIANMVTDHVTEIKVINGEEGAWKRDNLDQDVLGNGEEGTVFMIHTSVNKTFDLGNLMLRIEPLPN